VCSYDSYVLCYFFFEIQVLDRSTWIERIANNFLPFFLIKRNFDVVGIISGIQLDFILDFCSRKTVVPRISIPQHHIYVIKVRRNSKLNCNTIFTINEVVSIFIHISVARQQESCVISSNHFSLMLRGSNIYVCHLKIFTNQSFFSCDCFSYIFCLYKLKFLL
jgi:hypothetical protein